MTQTSRPLGSGGTSTLSEKKEGPTKGGRLQVGTDLVYLELVVEGVFVTAVDRGCEFTAVCVYKSVRSTWDRLTMSSPTNTGGTGSGRRRVGTKFAAEDQALDQIAKEVSSTYLCLLGWSRFHDKHDSRDEIKLKVVLT